MKNDVVAVVVTYNRKELLKKCLDSIISQENASCDIIVFDNSSNNETQKMMNAQFTQENIYYHKSEKNIGGAGGFSEGVNQAVKLGYKYIWIMDDDVVPDRRALFELKEADKKLNGNWGCLSSYAYWKDGKTCEANRQKKGLFSFVKEADYKKMLIRVKFASFVSMYVKSSVVKEVGLPIADYFIYTDDYEFTGRISRKYPIYVVSTSCVRHDMTVNRKLDYVQESDDRCIRYQYLYRNDVNCYRNYGFLGWIYIFTKMSYTISRLVFKNTSNKIAKISVVLHGLSDGIKFEPIIQFPH